MIRNVRPQAAAGYPRANGLVPRPRPAQRKYCTSLCDNLFRIIHDDGFDGGQLRIAEPTAALGLAGTLLAELAWNGHIDLLVDGTVVVANPTVPSDAAAHTVLADIAGESTTHSVSTLVHYLSSDSYELVARRMVRRGDVREEVTRRWLRSTTMYVPTSVNTAAWASAGLAYRRHRGLLTDFDRVMTGLVCAVGLANHVFFEASGKDITRLPELVQTVASPLPELVAQVRATVDRRLMTAR
jgi:hypothetical protein